MTQDRYQPPPPWFKVFSLKVIEGSIRFDLDSAERGVWFDLLSLANISPVRGTVCASKGVPFPLGYLTNLLNIPLELLESTITKCQQEGRITQDTTGIHITNWPVYQGIYKKQKTDQLPLPPPEHKAELTEEQPEPSGKLTQAKQVAQKETDAWKKEKDTERLVRENLAAQHNSPEAFQAFRDKLTPEQKTQIADYISAHPEVKNKY